MLGKCHGEDILCRRILCPFYDNFYVMLYLHIVRVIIIDFYHYLYYLHILETFFNGIDTQIIILGGE